MTKTATIRFKPASADHITVTENGAYTNLNCACGDASYDVRNDTANPNHLENETKWYAWQHRVCADKFKDGAFTAVLEFGDWRDLNFKRKQTFHTEAEAIVWLKKEARDKPCPSGVVTDDRFHSVLYVLTFAEAA